MNNFLATENHQFTALVLAAGKAKRFGQDKRFAQLANGQSVLQSSLAIYSEVVDELAVVVSALDEKNDLLPLRVNGKQVRYLYSTNCEKGMSGSLADGLSQLDSQSDQPSNQQNHLLVALADMPFIRTETVTKLIEVFCASQKSRPIVFPLMKTAADGDRRGHPVIFHRSYRNELGQLHGDEGAKQIITINVDQVEPVYVDDEGIFIDIDTPADLNYPTRLK